LDFDLDKLVETITKEILRRISGARPKSVLALDECPDGIVSGEYEVKRDQSGGYGYVLMTAEAYQALICGKPEAACGAPVITPPADCGACAETCAEEKREVIDLSGKRLLHERDLRDNNAQRGDVIKVSKRTIITALAHDYAKSIGVKIIIG